MKTALYLSALIALMPLTARAADPLFAALAGQELHMHVAKDSDIGNPRAPVSIVRLFASGAGQAINGRQKQWLVWDVKRGALCVRGAYMFADAKIRPVGKRECGAVQLLGNKVRLERDVAGKREVMEGQIRPLPTARP
jgi:hypothetical protein